MTSIITTKDLSVEDTSELKTGNTKRRHDMPGKEVCNKIADPVEREKCLNYQGEYAKKNTGAAPEKKAPMSSGIKKSGY
jgi:hypothetical protein